MSTATETRDDHPVAVDDDTMVSAEQVAHYLRDNPDFFRDRDELLAGIQLSHNSGSAVSLMERQVEVLRERHDAAHSKLHGLLDNAGYNEQLFHSTRKLILQLLEARTLAEIGSRLVAGLTDEFAIDVAQITLFGAGQSCADGIRFIDAAAAAAHAPAMMKNTRPLCGPLRDEERTLAFGADSEVKSAAVVKLVYQRPLGLLALGSRDAQQFDSKMETDFVEYIADVVSRLVAPHVPSDN